MAALKARTPHIRFTGCGGKLMENEGLESQFPIERFAVIGPVGAIKALPAAMRGARLLAKNTSTDNIDAAVLIDSWAFSRMAAERIRKVSPETKVIKYVAPQVWASRPKRAHTAARLFDGILTLFEFENPYFERSGAKVRTVGSSTFQAALNEMGDPDGFRSRHGIGAGPLLAVLPGSRRDEVRRLAAPFGDTIELLMRDKPSLRVVIVVAPAVEREVRALTAAWPGRPVFITAAERFHAFAAADAALAASGTVTTELAINNTPMVIGYRVGPLTATWIRSVITTPHIALLNIAAGRAIIPEFLQENCRPEAMAATLAPLLGDSPERTAQLRAFPPLLAQLGVGGRPAADGAAETVLEWIGRN